MADYIELNAFIKKNSLAATGGQAKVLIRSGAVLLNGRVETQNRKKLVEGDVVEAKGGRYIVRLP